ncbi:MAG: AbrB/MazE/SpoVT family DNA-binding domain-containing protein [Armatimonadota bacterium]
MQTKKLVRVSSKGQIVLPKRLREKMGVSEGDYLVVSELADGIIILGKSKRDLFDVITEPIRHEAERQGFTREELMEMIKAMRAERESNAA